MDNVSKFFPTDFIQPNFTIMQEEISAVPGIPDVRQNDTVNFLPVVEQQIGAKGRRNSSKIPTDAGSQADSQTRADRFILVVF